ncbi:MAG: hypothetical protein HQ515_07970, partial [Phycisphaeraceae bacterium]|nr:hypothetical protein [Phycisphaeraceae bacterium]
PDDLAEAVKWVGSHVGDLQSHRPFAHLADKIITQAWSDLEVPTVLDAMADTCIQFLQGDHGLLRTRDKETEQIFADIAKRHRLVEVVIQKIPSHQLISQLCWTEPRLIQPEDFGWSIQRLFASVGTRVEHTWAQLVWNLVDFNQFNAEKLDLLLNARIQSSAFKEITESFFTPMNIDCDRARELRGQYHRVRNWKQKAEPQILDWLPKDRIQFYLGKFEYGEPTAWWRLLREMTLEDTSTEYKDVFRQLDIRELPGWMVSDESTHTRILDAGEKYLSLKMPYDQEHLLNGEGRSDDAAVVKAFTLLLNLRSEKIADLSDDVWAHWIPVLLGPFGFDDDKAIMQILIEKAYQCVPDNFLETFSGLLRNQMAKNDHLFCLDILESLWDDRIANFLFSLLSVAESKPTAWGRLLGTLAAHEHQQAKDLAKSKLAVSWSESGIGRDLGREAALVLIHNSSDASWELIWPAIEQDRLFGKDILLKLAYDLHHNYHSFTHKLNAVQLAKLFLWLTQEFPYSTDPNHDGAYAIAPDDAVRDLRNGLINILEKTGTPSSCQAIQHIMEIRPDFEWMKSVLVAARKNILYQTWRPLTVQEFLSLVSRPNSFLVRDAMELQDALVEVLTGLEALLQGETPAAPDLWDQVGRSRGKEKFRPKDEEHFSDWIKRHLETALQQRGVVSNREVQIRRGEGKGQGERTDIHVTAIVPGIVEGQFDQVRVIIEAKGCWNKDLKKAMRSQLVDRYLKKNSCRHGIYLIGWYKCDQWDCKDYRRNCSLSCSIPQARDFFDKQARELSSGDLSIRGVVIDTALR